MTENRFILKWGIMATGGIAEKFVQDLLTKPDARNVSDVGHVLAAVASSTSKDSAISFLERVNAPERNLIGTYGSYAELVADPNVDIIYVATPHSHHFQNVMLALEAGKHVLCEKALTVTAAQAHKLVEKARSRGLFLMEAVWTRFFPLSVKIREMVKSGIIGTVYRVLADTSFGSDGADGSVTWPDNHRMVNPQLAGGVLLDLGIYSLTWLFQILYHCQPEKEKEKPTIHAAINKYRTGADEMTNIIVQFPQHKSMGIAMTNLRVPSMVEGHESDGSSIKIQGTKGEIRVYGTPYRPLGYKFISADSPGKIETVDCPIPQDASRGNWGHGMFWEADECARCMRDKKLESDTLPWSESIVIMETMDEALKQGGVQYPELITTNVFDAQSPLNIGNK